MFVLCTAMLLLRLGSVKGCLVRVIDFAKSCSFGGGAWRCKLFFLAPFTHIAC